MLAAHARLASENAMLPYLLAPLVLLQSLDPPPEFQRLDNGLRVAFVEDHTLPLISVQLWYRAGSACDDVEGPGLCHVARTILEQRHDAALRLRAAGLRFQSRTLRDACYFATVLPPSFLEYVLQVEAQRMRSQPVDRQELDAALRAAARDYGLEPENPAQLAERRRLAAMFPAHPYQHPPGLVAESLKDVSTEDVDEFLNRWFVAENATLLVVGDVQPVSALELVRKHFGKLPWAEPPRRAELPSPAAQQLRLPLTAAGRAGLEVAWLTPPAGAFENAAVDVLMQRLCNPVDGPLYRRLRAAGCPPPRWQHDSWREGGMLVLAVELEEATERRSDEATKGEQATKRRSDEATKRGCPIASAVGDANDIEKRLNEIERIVREELKPAAETVPSEIEFNRARALAVRALRTPDSEVRRYWHGQAGFAARALHLGMQEMVAGDLLLAEFELPRIERLTVADLQYAAAELRAARTVFSPHTLRSTSNRAQPQPPPTHLPAPLKTQPPTQLGTAAALDLLARHAAAAPPVGSPKPPASATTQELGNGVKVTVLAVSGLEPVTVRTLLRGGAVRHITLGTLLAVGSTEWSVDQYRQYVSYHGLDLYALGGLSRPGLDARGPASRVPQMIELQAELIRHPNLREEACTAAFEALHAIFDLRQGTPPDFVRERYYVPPGWIGLTLSEVFMPRRPAEIQAALRTLSTVEDVEVLVVGNVRPVDVLDAARLAWADWQRAAPTPGRPSELRTTTAPSTRPRTRVPSTVTAPADQLRTTALWVEDDCEPLTLQVGDTLALPPLDPATRDLTLHVLGWTLGAAKYLPPNLDAERSWLWSWVYVEDNWIDVSARPTTDDLGAIVETYLDHAQQVRRGKLPQERFETALRLARTDRLLLLDDSGAIADLLARGVANPWNLFDQRSPADFSALVAQAYHVQSRYVVGMGPGDHSDELNRFDSGAPGQTAPVSP